MVEVGFSKLTDFFFCYFLLIRGTPLPPQSQIVSHFAALWPPEGIPKESLIKKKQKTKTLSYNRMENDFTSHNRNILSKHLERRKKRYMFERK